MIAQAPSSTLFPYTTLFRSRAQLARTEQEQAKLADQLAALGDGSEQERARDEAEAKAKAAAQALASCEARRAEAEQGRATRSEEHTSELQSHVNIVCRLLLE